MLKNQNKQKNNFFNICKIVKEQGRIRIYFFGFRCFSHKLKPRIVDINKYAEWVDNLRTNKNLFVPLTDAPFMRQKNDPKVFAYYLPQYHSIPENDHAHGKGFTEWTNAAACAPQFVGHYQPKIPYDIGFYNLLQPDVMARQVELAKMYGLYGFCFYYYWFSGKKVLEKPLENFLHSKLDFKFHLCWANENWSKLWDGGNKEVILEQNLAEDDGEKFFADILPYIKDPRYEKIHNKPLLMIYRPALFEKKIFLHFLDTLNKLAQKEGFDGFLFMAANAFGFSAPKEWGMEGIIEFPPHCVKCPPLDIPRLSRKPRYNVWNMHRYIKDKKYCYPADYKLFKAAFPSWDNLPRKAYSGGGVFKTTPQDFEAWLTGIIDWTKQNNPQDEQYIYINAWNEWAEGAVLEPTTRYGYKALDIVKNCLEKSRKLK